jgi:uncharacterized protein YcnI
MQTFKRAARPSRGPRTALHGALVLAALAVLSAHVTISPTPVRGNATHRFAVRVPTERPEPTVKVRLEFPAGLGAPRFLTKPGWRYELEKNAEGFVTAVTWSGGEIGPDEFDEFVFLARVPAEPGTLSFRAEQTYKSGEMVAWAEAPGSGRPAATVEVRDTMFGLESAPAEVAETSTDAEPAGAGVNWTSMLALGLSILAVILASMGLTRRT